MFPIVDRIQSKNFEKKKKVLFKALGRKHFDKEKKLRLEVM